MFEDSEELLGPVPSGAAVVRAPTYAEIDEYAGDDGSSLRYHAYEELEPPLPAPPPGASARGRGDERNGRAAPAPPRPSPYRPPSLPPPASQTCAVAARQDGQPCKQPISGPGQRFCVMHTCPVPHCKFSKSGTATFLLLFFWARSHPTRAV